MTFPFPSSPDGIKMAVVTCVAGPLSPTQRCFTGSFFFVFASFHWWVLGYVVFKCLPQHLLQLDVINPTCGLFCCNKFSRRSEWVFRLLHVVVRYSDFLHQFLLPPPPPRSTTWRPLTLHTLSPELTVKPWDNLAPFNKQTINPVIQRPELYASHCSSNHCGLHFCCKTWLMFTVLNGTGLFS